MTRIAALMLTVGLIAVAGCGDDDKTPPKGKFYESCQVNDDCESPLTCRSSLCNIMCHDDAACQTSPLIDNTTNLTKCLNLSCYYTCETDMDCLSMSSDFHCQKTQAGARCIPTGFSEQL